LNDFNLNIQFFENLKKTVWEVRKLDKENLAFRLGILKEVGVINEGIYDKLTLLIKYLDEKWKISLTESNGGMLITHLSMALKRIEENEKVSNIDEGVFQEVLKSEKLEEIKEIYNDIEKNVFIEKLPEEEKKYILVNLLLIKENE
jgi:PRD domain-containing protein